jgi:hypothetical protein
MKRKQLEFPSPEKMAAKNAEKVEAYKKKLRDHDWTWEHGDSRHHSKGQEEKAELVRLQRIFDADCNIWNSIAPDGYKRQPALPRSPKP